MGLNILRACLRRFETDVSLEADGAPRVYGRSVDSDKEVSDAHTGHHY